ncbi:MAG: hypothetical protein ACT4P4_23170 [Betaproteobacteria bacterium]
MHSTAPAFFVLAFLATSPALAQRAGKYADVLQSRSSDGLTTVYIDRTDEARGTIQRDAKPCGTALRAEFSYGRSALVDKVRIGTHVPYRVEVVDQLILYVDGVSYAITPVRTTGFATRDGPCPGFGGTLDRDTVLHAARGKRLALSVGGSLVSVADAEWAALRALAKRLEAETQAPSAAAQTRKSR